MKKELIWLNITSCDLAVSAVLIFEIVRLQKIYRRQKWWPCFTAEKRNPI